MANDKVELNIGKEGAERSLDALISKARQLEDLLRKIATSLGSNPSNQGAAQLFSTAQQLSSVNSAISALQNSATTGGVAGAAAAGAAVFGRGFVMRQPGDPSGVLNVLQGAGVSGAGLATAINYLGNGAIPQMPGTFNGAAYVQQVIGASATTSPFANLSAAQVYGAGGYRIGAPGAGAYFPPGMNPGAAGPFQPPPAFTPAPPLPGMWGPGPGAVGNAAGILLSGAITTGIGYLNIETQRRLYGGSSSQIGDVAGVTARGIGGVIGGTIGAIAGSFVGNPLLGGALGAGLVGAGFEAVARYLVAPQQSKAMAIENIYGFGRSVGGSDRTLVGGYVSRATRLGEISDLVNQNLHPLMQTSAGEVATTYSNIGEALLAGGQNPFALTGSRVYGPTTADLVRTSSPGAGWAVTGANALRLIGAGREQRAEMYTRRLAQLFGNQAPQMSQSVAPIFATLPETGGNLTDILMRYGPEKTNLYERLQNDDLRSPVGSIDLATANAGVRSATRGAQIGSMQIRGSGSATAAALNSALETLAGLPGGKESLSYAQTRRQYVDALYTAGAQEDITGYGLASTRLAGRQARAELLPYAPANMLGLGVERLNLNRQQITRLQGRLSSLRAGGNLTEDQELRLTQQIEDLRTQNAGVISSLSEGMEDRLPALSAGRPGFATRLTSYNLAALNLAMMNSPVRAYGAVNGSHLAAQRQFVSDLGGSESDVAPRSRTQALNTDLGSVLARLANVLEKLAGNAPNPMRPTELSGAAYAGQQRQDLGQARVYGSAN